MPLRAARCGALKGRVTPPGDKSISHRALMLSAISMGEARVTGLLESEDVVATAQALRQCGVLIDQVGPGEWLIGGVGVHGLDQPGNIIDMGNSGTSARLFSGLAAAHPFAFHMTGDASLRKRPMGRVIEPLSRMGAQFIGAAGGRMPMTVIGAETLLAIEYEVPVPSAQVKSAVLLAALHAKGRSQVIERVATRDHTERMLRYLGADLESVTGTDGETIITIDGFPDLLARDMTVPGDPSSAAFAAVAAAIVPGSEIEITGIGRNPQRAGLYQTLEEMGADLTWQGDRQAGGETVGDLMVRAGPLKGVDVPAARAPSMIDEYPILAVAASCAVGRTVMRGLGELRVKESDRLAGIATGLAACGVEVAIEGDTLIVEGIGNKNGGNGTKGGAPMGGANVATALDHRMAMSFLVLGLVADAPVTIDDATPISTSYPGFVESFTALGADISAPS